MCAFHRHVGNQESLTFRLKQIDPVRHKVLSFGCIDGKRDFARMPQPNKVQVKIATLCEMLNRQQGLLDGSQWLKLSTLG